MARIETDPNYTAPTFSRATAATDPFKKEDVQNLAAAMSTHDHSTGKGVAISAGSIPNGTITSAMIADGTIQAGDLADGAVTSAKIADGTIATADHADASITNAKLASDTTRANLLSNGGFELWQRGNGPYTVTTSGGTSDRWQMFIAGADTMSVSKDTTNVDVGPGACAAVTFALSGGAGATWLGQQLRTSDYTQLASRTLSFSVRVRTATASAVRAAIQTDGTGGTTTYSSYHTGGGTYQTLTVTATVPSNAGNVYVLVYFSVSCTAYVDSAMLVVGNQPSDYAPVHPADDLARCQRYYEVIDGSTLIASGYTSAGGNFEVPFTFATTKASMPVMTKVGTWAVANCAQPTLPSQGVAGVIVRMTATATGVVAFNASGVGSIIAEANP